MSQMLKCPNPSCPYVFDPSQVPVGVVLSCPRCGMQFTLGPPPTAPGTQTGAPTAPMGAPSAPSGANRWEQPAHPEFEAVGRTATEDRDPDERLPSRGTNKLQVVIIAGAIAVLMAGTILTALGLIFFRRDSGSTDNNPKMPEYNVAVDTPPAGWIRDDNIRATLGSPFVMSYRRESPEAYVAFGANEPAVKGRSPRPTDMKKDLLGTFPRSLKFDPGTYREEVPGETTWLGQAVAPGHGVLFRAQSSDGVTWRGEAYTVAYKGVAYYWLAWCGENDFEGLKGEFAAFRGKFKLLDLRNDWKETRSNLTDFKGDTIPYTISDAEDNWKEVSAADLKVLKEIEPDLDRRLRIYLTPRGNRKARPEEAELSVYLLSTGGDPTQVAKEYAIDMETRRIKQANADFAPPKFAELTEPPLGDPPPENAPKNATVVRLLSDVKESKSANRLIVVSGIRSGDKVVVVYCWCEGTQKARETFESKFVQIAASLR
jgi:hypothetical protein